MSVAVSRELTPQASGAIRVTQPMSELDLAALFDEHLPNIAHRLADMGVEPAGPPYGRYHEFGQEHVDVEIGIPVDLPVSNFRTYDEAEPGELIASELPGGQVAITIHRGAYDKLSETYDALHDWIHEQGRDEGPGPWNTQGRYQAPSPAAGATVAACASHRDTKPQNHKTTPPKSMKRTAVADPKSSGDRTAGYNEPATTETAKSLRRSSTDN